MAEKKGAKKKRKKKNFFSIFIDRKFKSSAGIFLLLFSILYTVACISYLSTYKDDDSLFDQNFWAIMFQPENVSANISGKFGGWLAYIFIKRGFGIASLLFTPVFILTGLRLIEIKIKRFSLYIFLIFAYILFLSILSAFILSVLPDSKFYIAGGVFGEQIADTIKSLIGNIGLVLFLFFSAIMLFSITIPALYNKLIEKFKNLLSSIFKTEFGKKDISKTDFLVFTGENTPATQEEADISEQNDDNTHTPMTIITPEKEEGLPETDADDEDYDDESEFKISDTPYDPRKELDTYIFPQIELLSEYGTGNVNIDKSELLLNKKKIEDTLEKFDILIDSFSAIVGSTVTLYEIVPKPGIRIVKIKNLEDDIALSLAALGIRIIAPIPGKGTIGIEVPNKNPEIVSFRSLIVSEEFQNSTFDLPVALGKTIDNKPFIADLTKMPHLLIAGATGQGKSVGLNSIIASLLYKKHPAELKFILVDPKKVELPLFLKIERHYLARLSDIEEAVLTNTSDVIRTLKALELEMENRYNLLKDAQVRTFKEYNNKFISNRLNPKEGHKYLSYIILIIDEFADLIMTTGKEAELSITRLAQLSRAVGIHLIIATQRPSVNIITGIIKANFPIRIAFKVSAKVDSRTILDTSGAEQLIGNGDMLFSNGSRIIRLQGAFISTSEIEKITEFIGSQRGYPDAFILPEVAEEEGGELKKELAPSDRDQLFDDAARIIVAHQHGSASLLQRKLKLGYNRAGRLIDQLEAAGIVGQFEGSKAREVKYKDLDSLEQFLNSMKK